MLKRIRSLKWMVVPSALMLLVLGVGVIHGGGRWSGIDPEILINGHTINVWVGWYEDDTCLIEDVFVEFSIPDGTEAVLVAESNDTFGCDNNPSVTLVTQSSIYDGEKAQIVVEANVETSADDGEHAGDHEEFHTMIKIYLDGDLISTCEEPDVWNVCSIPFPLDDESAGDDRSKKDKKDKKDKKS